MGAHNAPRVLIVDNHETSRTSAARYLSATGWQVRVLEGVNDALALLSTRGFDALLLDLCLGEDGNPEGGMRIAEAARASSRATSIVVLSGYEASAEERARVLKSADAFLQKPQPMRDVERALRGRFLLR